MLIFNYSTVQATSVQRLLDLMLERNDKIKKAMIDLPLLQKHVETLL